MADAVPPSEGVTPITPQAPQTMISSKSNIDKVTEYLERNTRIFGERAHYEKYRRYGALKLQEMFNALVDVYTPLFNMHAPYFIRYIEANSAFQQNAALIHAVRIYISCWFMDLYAQNREAVKKISSLAFYQHYQFELVGFASEFDPYLVILSNSIRPTHVQGIMEDALYIPTFVDFPEWNNLLNPFRINNFMADSNLYYGITGIMRERKTWKLETVSNVTVGRPSWLLDWHPGNTVCAWFPVEGNYTEHDITVAYIIGVACTPRLAPRDLDDWQYLEYNYPPPQHILQQFQNRITPRNFYGAYEIREFELLQMTPAEADRCTPLSKKRKTTAGAASTTSTQQMQTDEPLGLVTPPPHVHGDNDNVWRYRIIDWTYYLKVIGNMDPHTRSGALRMLVFA